MLSIVLPSDAGITLYFVEALKPMFASSASLTNSSNYLFVLQDNEGKLTNLLLWKQQELDKMKSELSRIANVQLLKRKAIISLISNVKQSSAVLEKVLGANDCCYYVGNSIQDLAMLDEIRSSYML